MSEDGKRDRFALRPDGRGWTVFDVWTGEPSIIGTIPQTGLSEEDAKHTADLLNQRARGAQGPS